MTEDNRTQPMHEGDDALAAYLRIRGAINEKLDGTQAAVDSWIENQPMPPSLRALTELEVLLKKRRDTVQELVDFHDALIAYLIQLQGRESQTSTGSPEIS